MFAKSQEAYLTRQLGRGNVVLFLGAGFSSLATNRLGASLPTGSELAKLMWGFMYPGDAYDQATSLGELYEAILESSTPHSRIRNFLEEQLIYKEIPTLYQEFAHPFWFRVYTTNVDDLVERYTSAPGIILGSKFSHFRQTTLQNVIRP
ncbi:MAG: hypothetical protein M3167_06525 [Acidobacteriota bacterium]|nr:hypothetical protein [Acidobacteriota bacterium]